MSILRSTQSYTAGYISTQSSPPYIWRMQFMYKHPKQLPKPVGRDQIVRKGWCTSRAEKEVAELVNVIQQAAEIE